MRPLGGDQVLHRRFAEHGRGLGSLQLCRKSKESSFSANDCKLLDGIARFVAHGMTSAPRDQVFVDTEERAVIIVDQLGRTHSASSHAYRLLEMAFSPRWDSRARWHLSRYAQPELARLCRSLLTSTVGAISTEPPVCRRRNAWGEFVLRAYWLEPTDGTAASRFIAITIVQREPKHLRLLRQIERLPLTGREKQLCLLLTRDQARADIADTMGVSEATVI